MNRFEPEAASDVVTMEFKRYAQQMLLDANIMAEVRFSVDSDGYNFLRDQVAVKMVAKILTDDLPPEHVRQSTRIDVHEPASTWQMWKRNNHGKWYTKGWLPWLLTRRPVKTREYQKLVHCEFNLERYRAYPQARIQSPTLGRAVMFHDIRDVRWDGE
jgi:hypothetical protein